MIPRVCSHGLSFSPAKALNLSKIREDSMDLPNYIFNLRQVIHSFFLNYY